MVETLQDISGALWKFTADAGSLAITQTIENYNAVVTGLMSGGTEAFGALFPLAILIIISSKFSFIV